MSGACGEALHRLTNAQDTGLTLRLLLWRQSIEVWQAHPWLGAGAGLFMATVYKLQPEGFHQQLDYYAHNVALQVLAEFGLFAGLAIAISVVSWAIALYRRRQELAAPDVVLLYWVGVLGVHSMLEFPLFFVHFLVLFGLCVGLVLSPKFARFRVAVPMRFASATVALLVAVSCAFILVDYRRLDRLAYLVTIQLANNFGTNAEVEEMLSAARADVRIYEPMADHAIQLLTPLTKEDLIAKTAKAEKLISKAPTSSVVLRRIALAALAGDRETGKWHAARLVKFYPDSAAGLVKDLEAHFAKHPEVQAELRSILGEVMISASALRPD
jgi:hypothetical protein